MSPSLVLTYFPLPGRGEACRNVLAAGKVPFEDKHVTKEEWGSMKASAPFGQVPILTVDGKVTIAQSSAIVRYAARLAGLFPSDDLELAKAEMASAQVNEIASDLLSTMSIQDQAAKITARGDLMNGKVGDKLKALDAFVASSGGDYVLGSKLSFADIEIHSYLSLLTSGFLDGISKDFLPKCPTLQKLRNKVASIPEIAARYATATDSLVLAYKADA